MHDQIHLAFNKLHTLDSFEDELQISRYRLCREYKAVYGISPMQDLNCVRLEKAKTLLTISSLQVQEIGSSVGFNDVTHFIRLFKRETGLTPGEFRRLAETATS